MQSPETVEVLFAVWAEEAERGDPADFDALLAAHPQHADELRTMHADWLAFAPLLDRVVPGAIDVDGVFPAPTRSGADPDPLGEAGADDRALVERLGIERHDGGRYKFRAVLGRGGGGVVLKVFDHKLRRTLAMKVVLGRGEARPTGETPPVDPVSMSRFVDEARIASQLDHPGIVPVHEIGADETGRAFFTMRLVRGEDLAKIFAHVKAGRGGWSRVRALGVLARVCEIVAYAHENGVVHRDLKPANIMVGTHGEVHVMDWGLARAQRMRETGVQTVRADERAAEPASALLTQEGAVLGTPAYMAPEQARGDVHAVDHRCDVYAIGAIVYELLAGDPPYVGSGARTPGDVLQALRSGPPRPLATRAVDSAPELVAICERAMAREPERRYASVASLAEDLRAYLEGRVVAAYEGGTWAETRKWVRRNRALACSMSVAFLALVVGTTVSMQQAARAMDATASAERRAEENARLARTNGELAAAEAAAKAVAEQQAEAARQANRELTEVVTFQQTMLADVDATAMGVHIRRTIVEHAAADRRADLDAALAGVDFTGVALATLWSNVFEGAVAAIDAQFGSQPLVQAHLLQTAANALRKVGLLEQAAAPQQEALAIRRRLLGDRHHDTLASVAETGSLHKLRGRLADAEPLLRQAMAGFAEVRGGDDREAIITAANLGALLVEANRLDEAEPLLRDVVARNRATYGDDDAETLTSIGLLSSLLHARSRFAEAEQSGREALEGLRRTLGDGDLRTIRAMGQLGFLLQAGGKLDEAETLLLDTMQATRRVLGDDHPSSIKAVHNFAALLVARGKYGEAEPYGRDALARYRRILGDDFPETLTAWNNLAALRCMQGRVQEAEVMFRELAPHSRRVLGEDHPETVNAVMSIGVTLNRQGRHEAAEPFLREAEQRCVRVHGDEHAETLMARTQLAECLAGIGRADDAEALLRSVLEVARRTLGDEHPYTMTALYRLGDLVRQQARYEEAESYIRSNLTIARRVFGADHSNTVGLTVMLGEVLRELDKLDEAEPLLVEALAQQRRTFGDDSPHTLQATRILAELLVQTGRHAEGLDLLLAAEGPARTIWPSLSRGELGAFLCLLGTCRAAAGGDALPEAEANLLEAHGLFTSETPPMLPGRNRCARALAELHEAWHALEPGTGHDQQAARWRQAVSSPLPASQRK